MKALDL